MENFIKKTKINFNFIIFLLGIILLYSVFPVKNFFEHIILILLFLFIIPFIYDYFNKKNEPYIFREINNIKICILGFIMLILSLIISYFLFKYSFNFDYYVNIEYFDSLYQFFSYELLLILPFTLIYSYFFINFVFFRLENIYGYFLASIFQFLIIIAMSFLGGAVFSICLPYIVFAPMAVFLASKTRNFIYPAIIQFILIFIIDSFFVNIL